MEYNKCKTMYLFITTLIVKYLNDRWKSSFIKQVALCIARWCCIWMFFGFVDG
jgi:hypothetical protein